MKNKKMKKRKPALKLTRKNQEKYVRIAYDYYGSAIRDNDWEWKIEVGRMIDLDGYDPYGEE